MAALWAERDDPPDGSKKGPKGPSGMTHQTGLKKWRPPQQNKKPLTGAGWGKMMEGGGSRERFCFSSFVKIFYQL